MVDDNIGANEEQCPSYQLNICINYVRRNNINFKI